VLDTPRLKVDDDALLAMADRLFIEFAGQPAGSVLRAIANAHATLRGQDRASYSPEEVAEHARGVLRPRHVRSMSRQRICHRASVAQA